MTISDDEQIVRSAVAAPAQLPNDVMERLGDGRVIALLGATSALAILRKYSSKPEQEQVSDFVDSLKARFPDASSVIKPVVIEALIRFAFGETEIVDGIDSEDLRIALFVLPYAIISEENIHGDPLDEFVAEVLQTVDEV